jgi:hypothetical protein
MQMREGATDAEVTDVIATIWGRRTDRYSEERLTALNSARRYRTEEHRELEIISLGG